MKRHSKLPSGTIGSVLPSLVRRPARGWLHRAAAAIREFDRIQRDYERLLEMPDHVLQDIGLQRYQLAKELRAHRKQLFWISDQ